MTLGNLLYEARRNRKLTVREVLDGAQLKASPSLYSQWENHKKVPTPQDLQSICSFLRVDLKKALLLWAQAHMPNDVLKDVYRQVLKEADPESGKNKNEENEVVAYPAAVTLIIKDQDADFFADNLAAGTVLAKVLRMNRTQNDEWATPTQIAQGTEINAQEAKAAALELVRRKYLIQNKSGFRVPPKTQYIYMPETPTFERARRSRIRANVHRLLENITPGMIAEGDAVRSTVFKRVTDEKAKQLRQRFQSLMDEIATSPDPDPKNSRFHSFVVIATAEGKNG